MKKILLGLTMITSLLFAFQIAAAAELVTNGGFETGDFTGWFTQPAGGGGSLFGVSTVNPHSGLYAAYFGATGTTNDIIYQVLLPTVVGQSYTVSFWLAHSGTTDNHFAAYLNAAIPQNQLLGLDNVGLFGYTNYTYTTMATTDSTVLSFFGRDAPAYFYLDDVSVQDVPSVPEPATMLLLGTGLAGLAGVRRRLRIRSL